MKQSIMIAGMALLGAAGCTLDPRNFETEPVEVATSKGVVLCQLYTKETVVWDRAIDRPDGMSVQEADDICRAEGARQSEAG
ncbi:MAG: hypothetical protein AAFO72_09980 [Pseudomonadota bacterium]